MKYQDLLKDPRWQKLRLEVFERDGWECWICHSKDKTLNVHHFCYERGLKPWEYSAKDLITLCQDCHEAETQLRGEVEQDLIRVLRQKRFIYDDLLRLKAAFEVPRSASDARETSFVIGFLLTRTELFSKFAPVYERFIKKLNREIEKENTKKLSNKGRI